MATAAPAPISRNVLVHINFDHKTREIKVDPDTFWVSEGKCEEVVWYCTSTDPSNPYPDFTVQFKDRSPFYETRFSSKRRNGDLMYSGLVRRDVTPGPQTYPYSVTVLGTATEDPDGGVKP